MTEATKSYVLGFAFYQDTVLLINKERPDWQAGRLNGVGGKIEAIDESFEPSTIHGKLRAKILAAMVRECFEETNIETTKDQWHYFGAHVCEGKNPYALHLLVCELSEAQALQLSQTTDEKPEFVNLEHERLGRDGVSGLLSYIHSAMYHHVNRSFFTTTVET